MKKRFIIRNDEDRGRLVRWVGQFQLAKPVQFTVELYKKRRSNDSNAKMWANLTDISNQVEWHGHMLTKENWKDILTASLKKQQAVPGIDGGFVVLGARTSEMSTSEMSDVIELSHAFGAEQGVKWTDNE